MALFSFYDLYSHGFSKTEYERILVGAYDEKDAVYKFQREFDVNPYDRSCPCCGPDFSIYEIDEEEEQEYLNEVNNLTVCFIK